MLIKQARNFAKKAHKNQTRKYTGEPYFNHCEAVALKVSKQRQDPHVIAAAYLHDVIEDTDVTLEQLHEKFGNKVTDLVKDLTDHYTPEAYPTLNRAARKKLEAERLAKTSLNARIIKAADIEDNTKSITKYDPGFAKIYLKEKEYLLEKICPLV